MKRIIRLLVILIILAGAGYGAWAYYNQPEEVVAPNTTAVTRGDIELNVLATGTLNAQTVVSVGAEVSGRIDALHVTLGQQVAKGDLIAEIDPLDKQNAVKIARAALLNNEAQKRIQEANANAARVAAERAERLFAQNLISEADYQSAQVAYETAEAQIEVIDAQITSAELSVEKAELDLNRTAITAPMDGTVVGLPVEVGQTINAAQTSPTIVKLADLSTMIVKAGISEADVPSVMPGQRAYFTILGAPDTPIDATLLTVEPAPESFQTSTTTSATTSSSSAVYYNGVLSVPNEDGALRISMTAQVTIVTAETHDALVVPASAVSTGPGGGTMVQVYDAASGTTTQRRVTTGLDNKVLIEITEGLSEGEQVVTIGSFSGPRGGSSRGGDPFSGRASRGFFGG